MADWMYWITAIVFTVLGFFIGINSRKEFIISATIQALIDQGYLKTQGSGEAIKIVKYDE